MLLLPAGTCEFRSGSKTAPRRMCVLTHARSLDSIANMEKEAGQAKEAVKDAVKH
jgi:hypothetical protein